MNFLRRILDDDNWNPIFYLNTRWFWKAAASWKGVLAGILILLFTIFLHDTARTMQDPEDICIILHIICAVLYLAGTENAMRPMIGRYIEENLMHYTGLSAKKTLQGYLYTGLFYSSLIFALQVYVLSVFFATELSSLATQLGYAFRMFALSICFLLFSASLQSGIRKDFHKHTLAVVLVFLFVLIMIYGRPSFLVLFFPRIGILWLYAGYFVFGLCAYFMALANAESRDTFLHKMLWTIFMYVPILFIFYVIEAMLAR